MLTFLGIFFFGVQIDLVGGYYDAGDNVKFGLPMAFTITMMSWSILEYGRQMGASGELGHAMDAVKWGTDYLLKAHPEPYVLYGEVIYIFTISVKIYLYLMLYSVTLFFLSRKSITTSLSF